MFALLAYATATFLVLTVQARDIRTYRGIRMHKAEALGMNWQVLGVELSIDFAEALMADESLWD